MTLNYNAVSLYALLRADVQLVVCSHALYERALSAEQYLHTMSRIYGQTLILNGIKFVEANCLEDNVAVLFKRAGYEQAYFADAAFTMQERSK